MNAMTDRMETLPVAVIGAGPVGLAAAAHLLERGLPVLVLEAGDDVAAHLRDWGHVRLFSPWGLNIDKAAARLLGHRGWQPPPLLELPTGRDLYERYLKPLAETPELAPLIRTGRRVVAITRQGFNKVKSTGRERAPFVLVVAEPDGRQQRLLARAVIDCSGSWSQPNPLGADGLAVPGEGELRDHIHYGIPDIPGTARTQYAGKRIAVVGAGHSAANALLDLVALKREAPETRILWLLRGGNPARLFGSEADQLAARGALGQAVKQQTMQQQGDGDGIAMHLHTRITGLRKSADGILIDADTPDGKLTLGPVDRIIAATGQRPDLDMLRELRLDLDPWLESSRMLGPMIDPNVHSCGSVPPHGHRELAHPEAGFYTAGVKSYGRAPTFLLATGYEQVRSIAAALAGDMAAADDVRLVLPETGVCGVPADAAGAGACCGPAAKRRIRVKADSRVSA